MIKKLIFVCGPSGVGKSTACMELLHLLDSAAYVDSDWCSAINPFVHTEEMIELGKIAMEYMLKNYLQSDTFQYVIWHYGFHGHRKTTFDEIIRNLDNLNIQFEFIPIILNCELKEHIKRMRNDGRDSVRIQRAIDNTRALYDKFEYPIIDVTYLSAHETADEMKKFALA